MDTDHPTAKYSIEKYLGSLESLLHSFIKHSPFKLSTREIRTRRNTSWIFPDPTPICCWK